MNGKKNAIRKRGEYGSVYSVYRLKPNHNHISLVNENQKRSVSVNNSLVNWLRVKTLIMVHLIQLNSIYRGSCKFCRIISMQLS